MIGIRGSSASKLDKIYRSIIGGGVFPAGWGDPERITDLMEFHKVISNRSDVQKLIERNPSISIDSVEDFRKCKIYSGHFLSPFAKHFPGILPKPSENCKFQLIVPREWKSEDRPVSIHMAGTGDQYFWRRRSLLAYPLANENGVGSLLIENPFYGTRRPSNQIRSNVRFVSDIFAMGGGLMLESLTLLQWLEDQNYGPFCITGISMGGHMACLGATNYLKPIAVAPCLSWATASPVFTRGVMTNSINWKICDSQFIEHQILREDVWNSLIHYELEGEMKHRQLVEKSCSHSHNKSSNFWKKSLHNIHTDSHFNKLLTSLRNLFHFHSNFSIVNLVPGKTLSFWSLNRLISFLYKSKHLKNDNCQPSTKNQNESSESLKLANFYIMQKDSDTRRESLEFMRRLMDHFTHLSNFEKPVDPELAIFILAKNDAYVLRDGVKRMEDIWPGCTVRYINAGHVMAYAFHQSAFRYAICDAINKHRTKYYKDGSPRLPSISETTKYSPLIQETQPIKPTTHTTREQL